MDKIIFSKCSNERSPEFSLRTVILVNENGERYVEKIPDTTQAERHVVQIADWYLKLQEQYKDTGIVINHCKLKNACVQLEYLEGKTLERELDLLVEKQDSKGFCDLVDSYFSILIAVHQKDNFYMTKEFREVFGDVVIDQNEKCGSLTNIDALFCNIILQNEKKWCMLDYEWTFAFPIPLKFLLYRIMFYYVNEHDKRKCVLDWYPMNRLGISPEDEKLFQHMELNFQNYIQGNRIPIRDMYDKISPGIIHLDDMCYFGKSELLKRKVQIYHANHERITEEDSIYCEMNQYNHFEKAFHLMENVKYFRVDPCSCRCLVKNLTVRVAGTDVNYLSNATYVATNLLFDTEDPYILVENPENYSGLTIDIRFDVEFLGDVTVSCIKEMLIEKRKNEEEEKVLIQKEKECTALKKELEKKSQLIAQMESTKVWKVYQKYKSIISG
ncbi:MAG: hypothetical protein ACI4TF_02685 [Oliverpabstia sp.]